ncbi:MAG TPA: DMT family transporter [Candidatus Omnitrophota bacterium]|nr:DMT family transporter [Candidatus Omnitrophota bacterium]
MWLPLILITAFFISLQDVLGKKVVGKVDPYVVAWSWFFFSLPLLGPSLWVAGVPPLGRQFWPVLGVATALMTVASIFYFLALKESDLSLAVPMQALTPLFLLITSPVMLGEFPGIFGGVGVIFIVLGAYILHFKERLTKGFWGPFKSLISERGSRYMLIVAVLYSVSGNLDKIGVIHSSPLMWIFSLDLAVTIVLGAVALKCTRNIGSQVREAWPLLLALGICSGLGLIFQMIAIRMTIIPYLIAVKRTSVIMTSLFGFFLFKEKELRERLIGAILMVLGVLIIYFFQ